MRMQLRTDEKRHNTDPLATEGTHETREELLVSPLSIEHTGLHFSLLSDLALKTAYSAGELTGQEMAQALRLPFTGVVDGVLAFLDRQKLVQVTGSVGFGERAFRYAVSKKGSEQARELLDRCQYVGPAPVTLEAYNELTRMQGLRGLAVGRDQLLGAFGGLVLDDRTLSKLGAALNSGRSIFLYGPSGNGKTSIARAMARVLGQDGIYIPYAAEIGGQIIRVYDEYNHKRKTPSLPRLVRLGPSVAESDEQDDRKLDERWILIERPVVIVGGELNLNSLDLIHDPINNYYEAPYQMKANGGMFLIDDFGRQQSDPRDLLNRWIVPLETHVDYLTLHTGKKIDIPFEQLVVFATNIDPARLVDAAFLRRIHHKIKVDDPSPTQFRRVFELVCQRRGVPFDEETFSYVIENWYEKPQRALRNSHPRDLIDQILDISKFEGRIPRLTPALIDRACDAFFADL